MSYDPASRSDRNRVRRLIGDTDIAAEMLTDDEIDAFIEDNEDDCYDPKAVKYLAAADALNALHNLWIGGGRGRSSKKLGRLSIVYSTGAGINVDAAIQTKISWLRKRGAELASEPSYAFTML